MGEKIELKILPGRDLWYVKADKTQFEQVIINLAVNARDAMPEGGTLTIETRNQTLDDEAIRQRPLMRPGRYVQLAVSDTGVGMTPEVLERVFEPFFTTKEVGKGTGLGLSTCYGIVKQAGGFIWAYSDLGAGTTFRVYLPAYGDAAAPLPADEADAELPRGSETVLVVEDQDQVRDMVARVLASLGYRVLAAADGDEAFALANGQGDGIQLLLTDVVLPRTNGRRVAAAIGSLHPGARVLYVSGHAEEAIVRRGELEPGLDYLPKPFTAEVLARRVRAALDGRKS
jgi:CheY-like chemotaxis protein